MRKFVQVLCVLSLIFCMFGVAFANEEAEDQDEVLIVNLASTNRYNGGEGDVNSNSTRKLVIDGSVQLVSEPDMINNVGMEKQVRDVVMQKTIAPTSDKTEPAKYNAPKQPQRPSGINR